MSVVAFIKLYSPGDRTVAFELALSKLTLTGRTRAFLVGEAKVSMRGRVQGASRQLKQPCVLVTEGRGAVRTLEV